MIFARAVLEPRIEAAREMMFSSISGSIENLDLSCQENQSHYCKEIPYHQQMDIRSTISAWISTSRRDAGLNQTELGECLGVTKANVSSWENLRHEPSISQAIKIAEVCGTQLPKELGVESTLSEEALKFAIAYQKLPQQFRVQLLGSLTTAEIAARNLDDRGKASAAL